jgi:hypothetical protein
MRDFRIEKLPSGSLRITMTCEHCGDEVLWNHIAFTDFGKLLVGHCLCPGQQHAQPIGPRDQVVDALGRTV